jgi:hypothetical protein
MRERVSLSCGCKAGGKACGHPVDHGNAVSLPLQHKVNQRIFDATRSFIIDWVTVDHLNRGSKKGTVDESDSEPRAGTRSLPHRLDWFLLEGSGS